jgi:malate dehydrogenase (oxaloacetate-decarboxylating)
MNINEESINLHAKHHGKISLSLKVPLETKEDLSLAYTPGVAAVCTEIHQHPEKVKELTIKHNTIAVITDGSAVLGLGNIGPEAGLPVMEGKSALFKRFADLDAFPICLATQDTEEIIRTIKNIAPVFGGINLEDISAPRCFAIEKRLKAELNIPVMHDDQHGTAVVVLAGLINALKVVAKTKEEIKMVINGAGAAGIAIADLLLHYGFKNIILCDSQGVISKARTDLNSEKLKYLDKTNLENLTGGLTDALKNSDVFIGVSKGNLLTTDMIKTMNVDPIVIAMANPIPEIMPDVALSAGAKVVATGRSDFPNQLNNVLVFPGVFRGALDNNVQQITDDMLIKSAENIAGLVTSPTAEKIIPSVFDEGVVTAVSQAIK